VPAAAKLLLQGRSKIFLPRRDLDRVGNEPFMCMARTLDDGSFHATPTANERVLLRDPTATGIESVEPRCAHHLYVCDCAVAQAVQGCKVTRAADFREPSRLSPHVLIKRLAVCCACSRPLRWLFHTL
jgi:hypothetical protein